MKQINYKIKKGHVSYLWRGEGIRWFKARFKNTKRFIKNHFIELLVNNYTKISLRDLSHIYIGSSNIEIFMGV